MRVLSQVVLVILMVGVAVVAASVLSYMAMEIMSGYKAPQVQLALVGGLNSELQGIDSSGYSFRASVRLVNLGSETANIVYGAIVVMVKGTAGKAVTTTCYYTSAVTINPGEVKRLIGVCFLSPSTLSDLFGTRTPPADTVKSSMYLLHVRLCYTTSGSSIATCLAVA